MPKPRLRRTFKPLVEILESRELLSSAPIWQGFARDSHHTAQSAIASQSLDAIRWSTPVDTNPPYSGNELLIHYGSPMVTAANTVLIPVKTTDGNGNTLLEVRAVRGWDGSSLWTQTTDFVLPVDGWVPEFQPTLTPSNRLYYQGIGGQVYYSDNIDQSGATRTGTYVFYGQSNYNGDPTDYNNNLKICTPITSDSAGNIYFGYQVTGYTPLGLSSGIARIDPNGNGTYVAASAATGDSAISCMQFNSAPALSNDGTTLYVAVNAGDGGYGYLLALDSTALTTKSKALLYDPKTGNLASLNNSSTASPMVGPDGDVYFGVLENPYDSNNDRGWLLHFSGDLSIKKTPGAFGWDNTPSVVPSSMVPGYMGPSSYLLMCKYNNYAGHGTGNGQNKIAVLDPNVSFTDPISGVTVMNEVLTILGPTPDPANPGGVKEWCINSAAVDPASDSILAGSEDGKLYRWSLSSNTLMQPTVLTSGLGEAYTPTIIGADGTVYAVNNATLFAVGQTATISGQIYNDVNGNGQQDTGDNGLAGWTVFLDTDNNGKLDNGEVSTTTDSNGNYSFGELASGTYHVREVTPSGWVQTTSNQDVTLAATQQVSGVNYGNFQQISISGTVYNDKNDDHIKGASEPGISGVTINLDGSAAATTDANGNYTISSVGPGTHTLSEVIPSQYLLTSPASNAISITASSGTNVAGQNFGDVQPSVTSDNGQISYKESGTGWQTLSQGWNGSSRTHASASGTSTYASWTLTQVGGLPIGTYEIFVSYVAATGRDATTSYQVFDGTIRRAIVSVNQNTAPADGVYQGTNWKSLGKFTISHKQAKVRLNVENDGSVDADGVLLVPITSGAAATNAAAEQPVQPDPFSSLAQFVMNDGTGSSKHAAQLSAGLSPSKASISLAATSLPLPFSRSASDFAFIAAAHSQRPKPWQPDAESWQDW
jgi:hypothetical protein